MMRRARLVAAAAALVLVTGCSLLPDLPRPARTTGGESSPSAAAPPAGASGDALGLTRFAPADRAPLPALAGTALDGRRLDLASLRGKVVVLNAWASWCEPCRDELPVLSALSDSAVPDVAFVGLDVNDRPDGAKALASAAGIAYPSLVDDGGALLGRVPGVPPTAIPSTVVLDREGRVAARVIGVVHAGMLEPVLAALVAER